MERSMNSEQIVEIISETLRIEANGIEDLISAVDKRYVSFVDCCMECKGRIILTGMGKSGHVARKISATMTSLGTPSFFLHPAEAAHGDLGVIQKEDVVIMLSKSGNTDELLQLIASMKIIGCKIIGIFFKENSALEKCCDMSLILPLKTEACINNLAPTTSTTMMMALGDAIAVTLSKAKGFQDSDFAVFHPMGSLGKRLLTTARSLIREKRDFQIKSEVLVEKALWMITKNGFGAVVVTDENGKLLGLVTDGDIRRGLEKEKTLLVCPVEKVMTKDPIVVNEHASASEIFEIMKKHRITVVPVVNADNLAKGIVSLHDVLASGAI